MTSRIPKLIDLQTHRSEVWHTRFYQAMLEFSFDGVVLVNELGQVLYASPQANKMFGYHEGELIGRFALQDINRDDIPKLESYWNTIVQSSEKVFDHEVRFRTKDGDWLWVQCIARNLIEEAEINAIVVNVRDISNIKKMQSAYETSNSIRKKISNTIPLIVFVRDINEGSIRYSNNAIQRILGYSTEYVESKGNEIVQSLIHPEDRVIFSNIEKDLSYAKNSDQVQKQGEFRLRHADGSWRWMHCQTSIFAYDEGEVESILYILEDVTDRHNLLDQLSKAALTDTLTSIPNRRCITQMFDTLLHSANQDFTVFFVDVDEFKSINDKYGHGAGDELLQLTALRLSQIFGRDSIARLGGDEFLGVVMSTQETEEFKEKLLYEFSKPFMLESTGEEHTICLSVGICTGEGIRHVSEILQTADTAMYEAKKTNGITSFSVK